LLESPGVERVANENKGSTLRGKRRFEIGVEFGETTLLAVAESVYLIEENTDTTLLAGFDHLNDTALSEEGKDDLSEGGSGARVTGVELDWLETGGQEDPVGESGLADSGRAEEENSGLLALFEPAFDAFFYFRMKTDSVLHGGSYQDVDVDYLGRVACFNASRVWNSGCVQPP